MLPLTDCLPFLKPTKVANDRNALLGQKPIAGSASCMFCTVSSENGFNVVWENDILTAFHDHRPAAQYHILIIPKDHIGSVRELQQPDATLVRAMEAIGHKILDDLDISPPMRRMGFHIPPFNSVNHLHLHVHGLPYRSFAKRAKYPITKGSGSCQKGFSWFVEVGQAIRILEGGGRIGVFPC